ncbi:MAG: hypothetical protein JWN04_5919 [Myxococcaceae bacterium]|nr:hypothetical protein [Myxococcaceae bacterium]
MLVKQYERLWSGFFKGGAVKLIQRGPKEAVIASRGVPMLNGPRFAANYRAVLQAARAMFASTVYIRDLLSRKRDSQILLASWV